MNNVPNGLKKFNLEDAKAGHPLVTRDGREAKFIAYVPEANQGFNLVVMIDGCVHAFPESGRPKNEDFHLFLAPLGMCEGKPVFAGDIICNQSDKEFVAQPIDYAPEDMQWISCTWPKQKPVVETQMTECEIRDVYMAAPGMTEWRDTANKAIERSIADGDVIPTNVVEELLYKACTERVGLAKCTEHIISGVLQDYKEQLK